MERVICLLIGYVFGIFPTGYIIGRANGIDIRTRGSGNIGTTNMERTLGLGPALLTLAGDILKAIVPMIITTALYRASADRLYLLAMYTGLGAILGHMYPATLGFKGGKGVATSAGVAIFAGPYAFIPAVICFAAVVAVSGYVSLGSVIAALVYLAAVIVIIAAGISPGWNGSLPLAPQYAVEAVLISALFVALIIIRHRSNIVRVINGTENRLSFKWKR